MQGNPNFENHLLLIDKDRKLFCNLLNKIKVTDCSSFDPVVILPKSMDWFL